MRPRSSLNKWNAAGKPSGINRVAGVAFTPLVVAPLLLGGAALILKRAGLIPRTVASEEESVARAHRLGRSIVGNDRHAVSAVLGHPQASSGATSGHAAFLAQRWYYRLDSRHHIAIAIEFEDDVARNVQILHVDEDRAFGRSTMRHGVSA